MAENQLKFSLDFQLCAGSSQGLVRGLEGRIAGKVLRLYCSIYCKYWLGKWKVQVRSSKFNASIGCLLGALALLLRRFFLDSRLARAILGSDLAQRANFEWARTRPTRGHPLSNLQNPPGWPKASAQRCLGLLCSLAIAPTSIKEFSWSKLLFSSVLTVDFFLFSISFFIVKKYPKYRYFKRNFQTTNHLSEWAT